MNETIKKPITGTRCPTLFNKWQGIFNMPSRTDTAGHSGGSRKVGTGGGRLRQNQVLAVCTERSTGKSPPLPYHYGSERGGAPGAPPPLNPRLGHYFYAVTQARPDTAMPLITFMQSQTRPDTVMPLITFMQSQARPDTAMPLITFMQSQARPDTAMPLITFMQSQTRPDTAMPLITFMQSQTRPDTAMPLITFMQSQARPDTAMPLITFMQSQTRPDTAMPLITFMQSQTRPDTAMPLITFMQSHRHGWTYQDLYLPSHGPLRESENALARGRLEPPT